MKPYVRANQRNVYVTSEILKTGHLYIRRPVVWWMGSYLLN
jgi:hypothetical protein